MKKNNIFIYIAIFGIFISSIFTSVASFANTLSVPVASGDEISVERYSANSPYLLLWLAPEYGFRGSHHIFAEILQAQNIEVWQVNIAESLFLPLSSTTLKNLKGDRVADLISYAHKLTQKKIIVVADSYASLNALNGAHQWQKKKQPIPYFIGAILFSPNTYTSIPPLGQLPEYMPIISATNIPIMIYQAKNHGNFRQFNTLLKKLQQHGSAVYSRIVAKESIKFYVDKPDKKTQKEFKHLAKNIVKMISVLEKHAVPLKTIALNKIKNNISGVDIYLKEYKGSIKPININLKNAYGNKIIKNNFNGKVTIINFWATWCPPCVKEIPSLNRLKKKMKGQDFELISINYAEDQKTILNFMKKVNVEFPVLLDPNGSFAKKWNVIAYPSTFVIDKNGDIKYGVNAAIEWDDEAIINKIRNLL